MGFIKHSDAVFSPNTLILAIYPLMQDLLISFNVHSISQEFAFNIFHLHYNFGFCDNGHPANRIPTGFQKDAAIIPIFGAKKHII